MGLGTGPQSLWERGAAPQVCPGLVLLLSLMEVLSWLVCTAKFQDGSSALLKPRDGTDGLRPHLQARLLPTLVKLLALKLLLLTEAQN